MISMKKANYWAPAFSRAGAQSLLVKAGTCIEGVSFSSASPVMLPVMQPGEDYTIFLASGALMAQHADLPEPSDSFRAGGFHFAPGGAAPGGNCGGTTSPEISASSIWDRLFLPDCPNPRGMAYQTSRCWVDLYFLGANHITKGTSRNNVAIANGVAKPLVPLMFGGDGVKTWDLNWWNAVLIMASHGKTLCSYDEFIEFAYGAKENLSRGCLDDTAFAQYAPVTTGLSTTNVGPYHRDEEFTSTTSIIQATGVNWIWLRDMLAGYDSGSYGTGTRPVTATPQYYDITGGYGQVAQENERATRGALAGGKYNNTNQSGSRCLDWADALQDKSISIAARGRAGHLQIGS
ncbi:hypothetical protein [Herbaspirillum robiniae]|uniref:phage major tropism determinant n=1 Tax=Herbaspirillum robiniae TaxID=2014887 RepID=UPI0011E4D3BD|nr:hypothetical protein [Herbaspirillum robiniae]